MTQSDKDFITRIQVSQLVTQDPYADDFYAQVFGAIMRSRMGLQSQDERVLKFGSGGGIGLGLGSKVGNRRPNAMQRMEQQVERIVSNARKREEEKGLHGIPISCFFMYITLSYVVFSGSQPSRCFRTNFWTKLQGCSSSTSPGRCRSRSIAYLVTCNCQPSHW